jgi:DNA-binding transcriptional regulator YiaG
MKKSKLLADVAAARRTSGLNQSEFWSRFGVTQSGGSRYESGRNIPKPLKTLMWLYDAGNISDQDLENVRKGLSKMK